MNKRIFNFIAPTRLIALGLLFNAGCLLSCNQVAVYEKNKPIPNYEWKAGQTASGSIEIKDTASGYNIYIVLRHTDAYKYNNIWLNVGLQPPGDTMQYRKINVELGSDARGWEGIGMDDIWELRKLVTVNAAFRKTGTYNFSISQAMRDDPLLHIMSAGLRVEKARQ